MDAQHYVFAALALAGGILVPIQLWRLGERLRRRTARTDGTIVAVEEHDSVGSETPRTTWHARVRFQAGVRPFEFVSAYGNSWSRPTIGARVELRYDPRDPDNAEVDRGQSLALLRSIAILCALAGFGALAGIVACVG